MSSYPPAGPGYSGAAAASAFQQQQQKGGSSPKSHTDMFQTPHWRDLWAAVLFYVSFAAFAAIAGINIVYLVRNTGKVDISGISLMPVVTSLSSGLLTAILLTVGFVMLLYKFPVGMLKFCFVGTAALLAVAAGVHLLFGSAINGGFLFIFALIQILMYVFWRKRIPFSAVLMKNAVDIMAEFPATVGVSFATLFVELGLLTVFVASSIGLILMHNNTEYSDSYIKGTFYYSIFSLIWSSEVIRNVGVVTVSGVFATRYFLGKNNTLVTSPTAESFKRASTYSFGSVCFGSLIVAVIEFVKLLVDTSDERNSIGGAILSCLLGMIEDLVRYFNKYAYTQIAIYGKPYIEAAQSTWELVKSRGVEAIINDNLVGTALALGCVFIALISETVASVVFKLAHGNYEKDIMQYLLTLIGTTVIGFLVSNTAMSVINSGVTTTFVCLAEDPAALQRTDRELYDEIASKYGNIVV